MADLLPGAFAVYRADRTLVVPVVAPDAGGVEVDRDGLWLLDDEGIVHAEVRPAEGLAEAMRCDEGDGEVDRCEASVLDGGRPAVVVSRLSLEGEIVDGPAPAGRLAGCECFGVTPEAVEVIEPETAELSSDDEAEGEGPEPCAPRYEDRGAVSVVGGALYLLALEDRTACGGEATFVVESVALADGEAPADGPAPEICIAGLPFDDWGALDTPCRGRRSRRAACAPCVAPAPQGWVPMSWSGLVVEIGPEARPDGEISVVRSRPLDGVPCPSEADPCGAPEGFAGLESHDAYWVSSDGSFALALDGDELSVWLAGAPEPIWGGVEVGGAILGVRYHEDATALVEAMAAATEAGR